MTIISKRSDAITFNDNSRYFQKISAFIGFGKNLAKLTTCKRAKVGAIVFPCDLTQVYAIGYNGPARGIDNDMCNETMGACGCAHAEANALIKLPFDCRRSLMYCTHAPCAYCAPLIVNAGIVGFIYSEPYRDWQGEKLLIAAGVTVQTENVRDDHLSEWRALGRTGL